MSSLLSQLQDGVLTLTMNRPEVYNALGRQNKLDLIQAIEEANKNSDVEVIVLTAAGKAFCTGQDLNDRTVQSGSVDLGHTLETEWNPLVMALKKSEKITIAALNGVCAGAGVSVALAADLVISHPDTKFISGFSKIGLAPDAGSTHTFTHALGAKKALEFFLFNLPLSAQNMLDAGLINAIETEPLEAAQVMSQKIKMLPPLSVREIKKSLHLAIDVSYNESMLNETKVQKFLGDSADYQEGLKAFFEKRPPIFTGK